jgi:hypothetical protein
MVTQPCGGQPQTQNLAPILEDIVTEARPHLTNGENKWLEEFLTEYVDIFAETDEDYGRTNKVYYCIDTGDTRPIHQSPRRMPLTKKRR